MRNDYTKLGAVFGGRDHDANVRLVDLAVDRLALLADPLRIRILALLEQQEANVSELTDELGTTTQNISRHLNILYRSAVVSRRRDGASVYYALMDYSTCLTVGQAVAGVLGHIQEIAELDQRVLEKLPPSN